MQTFGYYALALILFSFLPVTSFGQSTFETVQTIMQASCAASGCHDGSNSATFSVNVPATDLYNELIDIAPANTTASAKGNKLVDPGHPYNSFLLRKVGSNGFDAYIQIEDNERSGHPATAIADYDIELIRQWIMAGAPESGTAVDYQLLQDYYTQGGLDFIPVPSAPNPSEGFQLRMGPIFLAPQAEYEYMKKEKLHNTDMLKVRQANGYMAWESHHMLLFKQSGSNSATQGLRRVPFQATPFDGNSQLTAAWQDDGDFVLPEGTALYWEPNTVLDFDYHIKNYNQTEILPADFYLNVYYSNEPSPIEMHAALENNLALVLFQGENTRTATHIPGGSETRYLYLITSHTHKYGTDYDIFLRNPDGTKGEQIYEGFYNTDYTFNQGFYNWNHPAIRYFTDLKPFKAGDGLIYETKWDVAEPLVTFGLTTDGEMMLFTYMYTTEKVATTGVKNVHSSQADFSIHPNPVQDAAKITFELAENADVKIELFDMLGKKMSTLFEGEAAAGSHSQIINADDLAAEAGIYLVKLTVDGKNISTQKITRL